jgi:hypothetical protein
MNSTRSGVLALVLGFSTSTAAADVLTVGTGPGNYPQIQPAIDAAVDGDVVLVQPGAYVGFTITSKSVFVLGNGVVGITSPIQVTSSASSQPVVLARLGVPNGWRSSLSVTSCAGAVRIQDCHFLGAANPTGQGFEGVRINASSNVVFARGDSTGGKGGETSGNSGYNWVVSHGGGTGAVASASSLVVADAQMLGGLPNTAHTTATLYPGSIGAGLDIHGGFALVAGSVLVGPEGGGNSITAFQCNHQVGNGGQCGDGGAGLLLQTGTVLVQLGKLQGGSAGSSACLAWYYDGSHGPKYRLSGGSSVATRVTGPARTLVVPSVLVGTSSATAMFKGAPGDLVYVVTNATPHFLFDAALHGVWTLTYPPQLGAPIGTLDATGNLSASIALPPLQVGETDRTTYVQTYSVDVFGGTYVGTPWSITLVP